MHYHFQKQGFLITTIQHEALLRKKLYVCMDFICRSIEIKGEDKKSHKENYLYHIRNKKE